MHLSQCPSREGRVWVLQNELERREGPGSHATMECAIQASPEDWGMRDLRALGDSQRHRRCGPVNGISEKGFALSSTLEC